MVLDTEMIKAKQMSLGQFFVIKAHEGAACTSTRASKSTEKYQAPALQATDDWMSSKMPKSCFKSEWPEKCKWLQCEKVEDSDKMFCTICDRAGRVNCFPSLYKFDILGAYGTQ